MTKPIPKVLWRQGEGDAMTQTLCDRCGATLDHFGFRDVCLRSSDGPSNSHYATPVGAKAVDNMNFTRDLCRQCLDEILGYANRKVTR